MVIEPDDEENPEDRWRDPEAEVAARFGDTEAEVEARFPDYEESAPEPPQTPDLSEVEPDRDTQLSFWAAVVYANVAVFLVAVGPMLAYFRGQTLLGAGMVVAGLLAAGRVYTIYRGYRTRRKERRRREPDEESRADDRSEPDEKRATDEKDGGGDAADAGA